MKGLNKRGTDMSDATTEPSTKPAKSGKTSLVVGLVLALAGAGGGFYAVSSGMILQPEKNAPEAPVEKPPDLPDIAFVAMDPIVISLNSDREIQLLRFRAQLEVNSPYQADVEKILPRVTDVLNGYLRALELRDLRDPLALTRLRAQMLRRIQIVAGPGRVRDLLIMEFVLN
jgi:flagellar protein FliL